MTVDYQAEPSGAVITRNVQPGVNLNTLWNGFVQLKYTDDHTRVGKGCSQCQIASSAVASTIRRMSTSTHSMSSLVVIRPGPQLHQAPGMGGDLQQHVFEVAWTP